MRKTLVLLALTVSITVASPALAQDTRIGLGVGISSFSLASALSPASIYLPIEMGTIRIEPELGIIRISTEDDNSSESTTMIQLGAGVFAASDYGNTQVYYGGRVGLTISSMSFEFDGDDESESSTSFFIGPAVGAQYFFADQFSLGGEAQLLYTSLGNVEGSDTDTSVIATRPVFFVRWFLN